MKYIQSEKYNIAWFKLAEYVSRKERERAMGVYRLLHHSLGDEALAAKLKGDLLLCFDENESALEKYVEAAERYKKEKRFIESIAVYEHLLFLIPGSASYLKELLVLYKNIEMSFNMVEHVKGLAQESKVDLALEIADNMIDFVEPVDAYKMRKAIVFSMIQSDECEEEKIIAQLKIVVEGLVKIQDQPMIQRFLSELEAMSKIYYEKAYSYM